MEKSTAKKPIIKKVFGVIIPVLCFIIAVVMVGVSFAWYSDISESAVDSLKLTTQDAFILAFESSGDSDLRNIKYKGQRAIDDFGRLVSEHNGRTASSGSNALSGSQLEQYLLDAPYYFMTTVGLDTDSCSVNISMILDYATISRRIEHEDGTSETAILNTYRENAAAVDDRNFDSEDIPYAFTWFFKPHTENSVNYVQPDPDDAESRIMKSYAPAENEEWFTPYGKLKFDANGLAASVNGAAVDSTYSPLASGLKSVSLDAVSGSYDFYIVFAPEKMFWAQFFAADRSKTVGELYSESEQTKIFGTTNTNRMYYSNVAYFGSKFEFGATIIVNSVTKP